MQIWLFHNSTVHLRNWNFCRNEKMNKYTMLWTSYQEKVYLSSQSWWNSFASVFFNWSFFSYYWMAFHGCIFYHFLFLYSFLFSFFFLSHSFHIFFFFTSEKSFSLAMVDHFLFSYLCIRYMYEAKYKVLARKEKW